MRLNIIFLILGVVTSAASKWLQFRLNRQSTGNLVVMPAATFLVLAAIFSVPAFNQALGATATRGTAIATAVLTCAAVTAFQVMMINFVARKWLVGACGAGAFVLLGLLATWQWLRLP